MADLPMHSNLLAVYPHILERMKTVSGVKSVREVGDLNHLLNTADKRRLAAAVDGAVYVVFGGNSPDDSAGGGRMMKETLYFTFVLCRHNPGEKPILYEAGQTLAAIQQAFQGWDAGREYVAGPFQRTASPAIEYNDKFVFFPISFTVPVVLRAKAD